MGESVVKSHNSNFGGWDDLLDVIKIYAYIILPLIPKMHFLRNLGNFKFPDHEVAMIRAFMDCNYEIHPQ